MLLFCLADATSSCTPCAYTFTNPKYPAYPISILKYRPGSNPVLVNNGNLIRNLDGSTFDCDCDDDDLKFDLQYLDPEDGSFTDDYTDSRGNRKELPDIFSVTSQGKLYADTRDIRCLDLGKSILNMNMKKFRHKGWIF